MLHTVSEALRTQGRVGESIVAYRAVLELYPDFAPSHASLGIALYRMQRDRPGLEWMQRALECPGDRPSQHVLTPESGRGAQKAGALHGGDLVVPCGAGTRHRVRARPCRHGVGAVEVGRYHVALETLNRPLDLQPELSDQAMLPLFMGRVHARAGPCRLRGLPIAVTILLHGQSRSAIRASTRR